MFQYPGVTLVLYDWEFIEDQPLLSALKRFQYKILNALASRKESILAAARLMEEHPGVSCVNIEVADEDLAHLKMLEAKTIAPYEHLYLTVARVRVPVREDPSSIELEILLKKGYSKHEKTIGQVVTDLPPPFACSSWNGEAVVSGYQS